MTPVRPPVRDGAERLYRVLEPQLTEHAYALGREEVLGECRAAVRMLAERRPEAAVTRDLFVAVRLQIVPVRLAAALDGLEREVSAVARDLAARRARARGLRS